MQWINVAVLVSGLGLGVSQGSSSTSKLNAGKVMIGVGLVVTAYGTFIYHSRMRAIQGVAERSGVADYFGPFLLAGGLAAAMIIALVS